MLTLGLISLIVNGLLLLLVAWLSGILEFGLFIAGDGVERARVPNAPDGARRRVGAHDHDVPRNERYRVVGHPHLYQPRLAKARDRLTRGRINRSQVLARRKDDAWRQAVATGPVRDTPPRRTGPLNLVAPLFGPRHRVERNHTVGRRPIHDPVHDDRSHL